jgi:hypothetical protein
MFVSAQFVIGKLPKQPRAFATDALFLSSNCSFQWRVEELGGLSYHYATRRDEIETSVVTALMEVGRRLVNPQLAIGEAVECF